MLGLGAVAGVAAPDVGGFGYSGGWLRPDALTPPRFADGFENVYGRHVGFRRNHAKGLSATGSFESTGAAATICRAAVFRPGSAPLIGRFSLSGGLPDQADKPDTVRGLGLLFDGPGGQQWRTAMINIPVFLDATPEAFHQRLLVSKTPAGYGPARPAEDGCIPRPPPGIRRRYGDDQAVTDECRLRDSTFHALNAFQFTNGAGVTVPVRWSVVPQLPNATEHPGPSQGENYVFDDLIRALAHRALKWRLVLTVGEPHDPTNDATWSEYLLYTVLFVQPLTGWAMLSAARLPVTIVAQLRLPGIAPHNIEVYAVLRECHGIFGFLLFATFTAHICAVLFHPLVLRDRIIDRMALSRTEPEIASTDFDGQRPPR